MLSFNPPHCLAAVVGPPTPVRSLAAGFGASSTFFKGESRGRTPAECLATTQVSLSEPPGPAEVLGAMLSPAADSCPELQVGSPRLQYRRVGARGAAASQWRMALELLAAARSVGGKIDMPLLGLASWPLGSRRFLAPSTSLLCELSRF